MPSGSVCFQLSLAVRLGCNIVQTATRAVYALAKPSLLVIAAVAAGPVGAATSTNANSPLGVNLDGIATYSTEQPFLNIFHNAAAWTTHGSSWDTAEEQYLDLDADGYPKTLTVVNDSNPQ